MSAEIIDGKIVAQQIKDELIEEISLLKTRLENIGKRVTRISLIIRVQKRFLRYKNKSSLW